MPSARAAIHRDRCPRCLLWVTSVALCNRRPPVDFRYALLATVDAWRCNMSRRATSGLIHRSERHLLRGRDASYLAPPAQIRTCGFPAYGLYGAFFVKGGAHHFFAPLFVHSFVRPAPRAFFRPDRIVRPPSRAARVKDGASSAPPKACP